jgi:chromosome segregation ATPase
LSEQLLMQILDKLTSVDTEVKELRQEVNAVNTKVDRLEREFEALNTKVDKLEDGFVVLNAKVDKLEDGFEALNTKVDKLDKEVASIKSTMATKEDVKELPYIRQAVIEINERTKHIEMKQDRQQETIVMHDHQFNIVNKRIFSLESEVDRLKSR